MTPTPAARIADLRRQLEDANYPYHVLDEPSIPDAAYHLAWVKEAKYCPPVARVDNVFGDRNPVCSCVGMENYS